MNWNPSLRSVEHTAAEICLNCWYFVDETGVVLRLAAKAYALTGSDEEKLAALKAMSGADHTTALHGNVPAHYSLSADGHQFTGAIPASALEADPLPVFDPLIGEIEASLPHFLVSHARDYSRVRLPLREPILWVLTAVMEREDGVLVARVS